MKKIITSLFLVCLFFTVGFTQVSPATIDSTIIEDKQTPETAITKTPLLEKSLLWRISGNDLEKPSYLYGTIHMINKEDYFLTEPTKKAFNESDRVAFEVNLSEMDNMGAQLSLLMQAFMKGGVSLSDLLNEEDYDLVSKHFEELGLPMMFLDKVKPMFLSSLAAGGMGTDDTDAMTAMVSYEMELMEIAKEQEMEIEGLETAEYQMSMFDSIPYKVQAEMLVAGIKDETATDDQFDGMIQMYKDQDINAMQTMIEGDDEGIGQYEELLLVNRNKNWIPVMSEMMKDKITFFAVGAGHLAGKQGVINLLKEAGYTVESMRVSESEN